MKVYFGLDGGASSTRAVLIDENGIVFDIIDDMSLSNYAEDIIQIFKKHNIKSNENIKK